jgi:hypothetical protein
LLSLKLTWERAESQEHSKDNTRVHHCLLLNLVQAERDKKGKDTEVTGRKPEVVTNGDYGFLFRAENARDRERKMGIEEKP